ncbi:MAG: hypothetical protein CMD29_03990 [Flavobacteriales bacterium]|nr:hypothetical protein [Flavobacteriales bacterium]
MRKRLVILMILMFAFSLNAQENEFISIKNSLSEKNTPNSVVNKGDLKKIKFLLKDHKPFDRNDPRLNKKNGLFKDRTNGRAYNKNRIGIDRPSENVGSMRRNYRDRHNYFSGIFGDQGKKSENRNRNSEIRKVGRGF